MTALIITLSTLALLLLLLSLPLRVVIACREGVSLKIKFLFLTLTLFPKNERRVKPRRYTAKRIEKRHRRANVKAAKKAAKKQRQRAAKKAAKAERSAKKPPTLREKLVLVRVLTAALLKKTHKHLKLTAARLHVRVATGDAASTAILYGAVSASLSYLLVVLDRITALRASTRDIRVSADYLAEHSSTDIKLVFQLRVWGALAIGLSLAIAFVKSKITNKTRGGKQHAHAVKRKEPHHG